MGGTFDPIHYGHLATAETVRQELKIDQVLLIPSGQPPHKTGRKVSPAEDRYQMTALAAESNPYFIPSRIEIDREGYTYSVDTVREIRQEDPEMEIFFITGTDAFQDILTWRTPQTLADLCHLVVATRPGYRIPENIQLDSFIKKNTDHIHFLKVPSLDISSSDLREQIRNGRSLRYLVPEPVENYIKERGLYR